MGTESKAPGSTGKRAVFLPLLLVAVVYLLAASGRAVIDYDEGYYAQAARQMIERGDWVTPYANGVRFLEKPPLMYWLTAASFLILGIHEFALRLPTALGVIALVWVVMRTARRAAGDRAAILAGTSAAFCAGTFLFTREALHDIWLVLFVAVAMCAFLDWYLDPRHSLRPALLFYVALAGAVLCKSLVGLAFPAGIVAVFFLLQRDWPGLRTLHLFPGSLAFLALAVPWHALAAIRNPDFLYAFFMNEQVLRFFGRHDPPVLWSVPVHVFYGLLLVWFFPWTAFLPAALKSANGPVDKGRRALGRMSLAWIIVIMGFYTVTAPLEHYAFPVLPALSLLVGLALSDPGNDRMVKWGFRGLALLGLLLLAAAAAAGIWLGATGYEFGEAASTRTDVIRDTDFSILADMPPPMVRKLIAPALATVVCMALGFLAALRFETRRQRQRAVMSLALVMAVVFGMTEWSLRICEDLISSRKFALAVAAEARPGDRLVVVGDYESANSLNFYQPLPVQVVDGVAYALIPGMKFPDAPQIVLTREEFESLWQGRQRVFALLPAARRDDMVPGGTRVLEVLGRKLIRNQ